MTNPPAALAMNALAEAIRQAGPSVVPNAGPRAVVLIVVLIEVLIVVLIEGRQGAQMARDSAVVVRCWRRRSRGFPSRLSPKA